MTRRSIIRIGLAWSIVSGTTAIALAACVGSSSLEKFFVGDAARSLAWGPALFRSLLAWHGLVLLWTGLLGWHRVRTTVSSVSMQAVTGRGELEPSVRLTWLSLAFLSLLGLGLRLWRVDTCLWLDEVVTLVRYARCPLVTIVSTFPDQNQHILYSVLAHISLALFGESAAALRLPSVIFGTISIPIVYALGRFVASRREALLAAVLLTVSYHHVWFSQSARGYAGLLFFTLLGSWLFLRGLRDGRWRSWTPYAFCLALGLWIHLTMAFVIAGHVLIYVWLVAESYVRGTSDRQPQLDSSNRWRPLLALVLAATLAAQLYALVLPQFFSSAIHEVSLPSKWTEPLWVVRETLMGMRIGLGGVVGGTVGAALFLAGLISFARTNRILLAMFLPPALLGFVVMLALGHNLWPRFFFFTLGFVLLILVRGAMLFGELPAVIISRTSRRHIWAQRLGTIAVVLLIAVSAASLYRCYRLPKQDYLGAKSFVESRRTSEDTVVTVGLASIVYGFYYAPEWTRIESPEELKAAREGGGSTWLVYTFPPHMKSFCPELWVKVRSDFEVAATFAGTLNGGEVYVCHSRSETASL